MKNESIMKNSYNPSISLISKKEASQLTRYYGSFTDKQLATLAAQGNDGAMLYLCCVRHAPIFYSIARKYCFNYDLADFAQSLFSEVYIKLDHKLWSKMAALECGVGVYLYGIVQKCGIKLIHTLRGTGSADVVLVCFGDTDPDSIDSLLHSLGICDDDDSHFRMLDALAAALEQLDPTERYVAEQHILRKCSCEEIGRTIPVSLRPAELRGFAKDLSGSAIRNIFNSAKDNLRKFIEAACAA